MLLCKVTTYLNAAPQKLWIISLGQLDHYLNKVAAHAVVCKAYQNRIDSFALPLASCHVEVHYRMALVEITINQWYNC